MQTRGVTSVGGATPGVHWTPRGETALPAEFGEVRPLPDPPVREQARRDRRYAGSTDPQGTVRIPRVARLPQRVILERSRVALRAASATVACVALVGAGVVGWDLWGSGAYASHAQQTLATELTNAPPILPVDLWNQSTATAQEVQQPPAPVILADSAQIADGTAMGRVIIEKIGVDATFVYGTADAQLATGPGLWKWGAAPGQPGNAMIAAHRTTYGAWFHDLDKLVPGDRVVVEMPDQPRAVFEVRETRIVDASDVAVTDQTAGVRLTLSACHPLGSAKQRIVVQTELVEGSNVAFATPPDQWTFQG